MYTMKRSEPSPKRPWLRFGPGVVLALALSALIASQWIKTEIVNRRQPSAPPIVESQVLSYPAEEKLGPTPEVGFVIENAVILHLSSAQLARLRSLQSEWERYSKPKMAQARQAAAGANEYLNSVKSKPRTSMAQIQDKAASLVALSREISEVRRSTWERAVKVLTPEQSRALENQRQAAWSKRKKALTSR